MGLDRGWKLGTNIIEGLAALVAKITDRHGPMSIVGWSLGGIFGRLIASESPDLVRQVITLGSPIQMRDGDDSAPSALWKRVEHLHIEVDADPEVVAGTLPVPTPAIYSRTDGVVHWSTCLVESSESDRAENVEVFGSHCGLAFNPSVAVVVADRLAQRDDQWASYVAREVFRDLNNLVQPLDKQ